MSIHPISPKISWTQNPALAGPSPLMLDKRYSRMAIMSFLETRLIIAP